MKKLSTTYSLSFDEMQNLIGAIDREMNVQTSTQVSFSYNIGVFEMVVIIDRPYPGNTSISFFGNDGTDIIIHEKEMLLQRASLIQLITPETLLKRKLYKVSPENYSL
jgi:hypothetical protein